MQNLMTRPHDDVRMHNHGAGQTSRNIHRILCRVRESLCVHRQAERTRDWLVARIYYTSRYTPVNRGRVISNVYDNLFNQPALYAR